MTSLAKASVGLGWHGILERLFAAKPEWIKVVQVKEKFGGLRFYLDDGTVRVDFIGVGSIEVPAETDKFSADQAVRLQGFRLMVREAEAESYTVCENCGAPGKPEGLRWISTLCPPCRDRLKGEQVALHGPDESQG
jgi:hypothetical protein